MSFRSGSSFAASIIWFLLSREGSPPVACKISGLPRMKVSSRLCSISPRVLPNLSALNIFLAKSACIAGSDLIISSVLSSNLALNYGVLTLWVLMSCCISGSDIMLFASFFSMRVPLVSRWADGMEIISRMLKCRGTLFAWRLTKQTSPSSSNFIV